MQSGDKGFALLIVLWSLVVIGLLTTQIIASGRTAMLLAGNVRDAAQAQAAADAGINETIFHLEVNGAGHWQADGSVHVLNEGGIPVAVRAGSLAGKINPNLASPALLAGLFQAVGASPVLAQQIAEAIVEWRSPAADKQQMQLRLAAYRRAGLAYGPPGHKFADLSELADIDVMPAALLLQAMPYLNLYQSGDPDPTKSDPVVRQALALSRRPGAAVIAVSGATPVFSIQSLAGFKGRLAVHRAAIVAISGVNGPAPFRLLCLNDGE